MEELWYGSSTSPPVQLPMSNMVSGMLQAVEFDVAGSANSLAFRKSSLLPRLSHMKQKYWYNLLDDKDLFFPRQISPEFADIVDRSPDKVASAS